MQPLLAKLLISPDDDDDDDEVKCTAVILRLILKSDCEYGARFWVFLPPGPFLKVVLHCCYSYIPNRSSATSTGQMTQMCTETSK